MGFWINGAVYFSAAASGVAFVVAFERFGVIPVAGGAVTVAREAIGTLSRKDLSADEKEVFAQAASIRLLRAFGSLSVRGTAILGAALIPAAAFQVLGSVPVGSTLDVLATWPAIIIGSVVMTAFYFIRRPSS